MIIINFISIFPVRTVGFPFLLPKRNGFWWLPSLARMLAHQPSNIICNTFIAPHFVNKFEGVQGKKGCQLFKKKTYVLKKLFLFTFFSFFFIDEAKNFKVNLFDLIWLW